MTQNTNIDIPTPTVDEVEKYLKSWKRLEDQKYKCQEESLDLLFKELCPKNTELKHILLKCASLNDFYSTNIFSVYPVAKHILSLKNIDERLKSYDTLLVSEIQKVSISDVEKNFYSFASKYCSHHNPNDYPIYDSYVDEVLRYFRNKKDLSFRNDDLKDYDKFKSVILTFRDKFSLQKYNLKQIDRYLWQLGKKYFPKKYN